MTVDEIRALNAEQIEARAAEIKAELENADSARLDELNAEVEAIEARRKELEIETRKAKITNILGGAGNPIPKPEEKRSMTDVEVRSGVEYKNAWLKHISGREISADEQRTLTTGITGNTSGTATNVSGQSVLVPTEIINNIWSLIEEQHPILGDITVYKTGTVIELIQHKTSSGASLVAEGTAPAEETNTFVKITLAGKDFAKWLELTYRMDRMAIPALQAYLEREIAAQISYLMAKDVADTIKAAIPEGNKVEATAAPTFEDVCKAFGTIKGASKVNVYGNRKTIYAWLVGLVNKNGTPILQQDVSAQSVGRILGASIKEEDAFGDDYLLICDPTKCVNNVVQDVMVESQKDIKTHKNIYSGYACMECGIVVPNAFAEITVGG